VVVVCEDIGECGFDRLEQVLGSWKDDPGKNKPTEGAPGAHFGGLQETTV